MGQEGQNGTGRTARIEGEGKLKMNKRATKTEKCKGYPTNVFQFAIKYLILKYFVAKSKNLCYNRVITLFLIQLWMDDSKKIRGK